MLIYQDLIAGTTTYDQQEAINYYEKGHDIVVMDYKKGINKEVILTVWKSPITRFKRKKFL